MQAGERFTLEYFAHGDMARSSPPATGSLHSGREAAFLVSSYSSLNTLLKCSIVDTTLPKPWAEETAVLWGPAVWAPAPQRCMSFPHSGGPTVLSE